MNAEKDRYEELIYRKRPVSAHIHMDIGHRAKQFAPFAALEGFEETIRLKERNLDGDIEDKEDGDIEDEEDGDIEKDIRRDVRDCPLCNMHTHII